MARKHLSPAWLRFSLTSLIGFTLVTAGVVAQSSAPIAGHYPGGHVGLVGGVTPPPSWAYGGFIRVQEIYALKNDSGDTVQDETTTLVANINVLNVVTKKKLLGGNFGWMLVLPFNEKVTRPNSASDLQTDGFAVGDIAVIPLALYWKNKTFDWQAGVGAFAPTGKFEAGGSTNHGTGFWSPLLSLGGVWYPGGKREAWNVSAVSRWEFNGTQEDTDIDVGDDVVLDWGVGRRLRVGKSKHQLLNVGISGFATWQLTSQSGPQPSDSAPKYEVFAVGPEIHWAIPKDRLRFLLRVQFEFGAKNAVQSNNYWFSLAYVF